jgi:hypothetical protein
LVKARLTDTTPSADESRIETTGPPVSMSRSRMFCEWETT